MVGFFVLFSEHTTLRGNVCFVDIGRKDYLSELGVWLDERQVMDVCWARCGWDGA